MQPATYNEDGVITVHNHEFMEDPRLQAAYARGVQAAGGDYQWHWRVHLGLWAAQVAARLKGDVVECGVNRGFLSSAIMRWLDWDSRGRQFYLPDTFRGSVGAPMLLDDDAYHGYRPQKVAMDRLALHPGTSIASLPTGQGLLINTP